MKRRSELTVQMIPIDQIEVVNSRSRGKEKFKQIIANISSLGLKKPITLARREPRDGKPQYELVCGEGRIESYKALGQTEVPALIVDATREELLLMGLAENIGRRSRTTLDMARQIMAMRERGDKPADIARKVDLDVAYVNGIIKLLKQGENRLITAVEKRQLPLSVAIAIAESRDEDVQRAMTEAYERGDLRGRSLLAARRLIEKRRRQRKSGRQPASKGKDLSANVLVKEYKKEVGRQQMLIEQARHCEMRLRFVVSAMKRMLAVESLVTLLRAEKLSILPKYLSSQTNGKGVALGA
jgi:ParB family transcriptional regulator, chromosome partitioning protein